jgi:hypothetical protein
MYERGDPESPSQRADAVATSDGIRVVAPPGTNPRGFARQALETTVDRDLRERFEKTRIGDPDTGDLVTLNELLPLAGISPFTGVVTNRGRKRKWEDPAALRAFADGFVRRRDSQGLNSRQALIVMKRAEDAGIVEIERRSGRPNVYRLLPAPESDGRVGQDVHDMSPAARRRFWENPAASQAQRRPLDRSAAEGVNRAATARRKVRERAARAVSPSAP